MDEPFKDNLVEDFNYDYDYPDTNNGEKSLTKWHELDIILRKILCGGVFVFLVFCVITFEQIELKTC